MSRNLIKSGFKAFLASFVLVFFSLAAVPRLGMSDVPELPTADGAGDTPDMFIKLVPNSLSPAAGRSDSMRLSSLRGRVALLDMFWSQCPHCEEHAPHVVEIYSQYRQRGFTVLGLATDTPDKAEDVKTFMRKTKINYPVGFITTEVIAYYADSKNRGVPQMILFGTDGKMVKRLIGWNPQISQELKQAIDEQLAKVPTVKPGSKASSKSSPRKVKQV
jgi:glutathione peroxidase-family protein